MTDTQIFARFPQEAPRPGREPLFGYAAARKVVEAAADDGLAAVGIEGFAIVRESVRPDMAAIADFSDSKAESWSQTCRLCREEAECFLAELRPEKPDLVFSIILLSD